VTRTMVSVWGSKTDRRPSASTAIVYSLMWSERPWKCSSQIYLSTRARLSERPRTPDLRSHSYSCRSASVVAVAGSMNSDVAVAATAGFYAYRN